MELTEDEKFAVCALAGVQTVVSPGDDFTWHRRTVNPCAIIYDGENLTVYEGRAAQS